MDEETALLLGFLAGEREHVLDVLEGSLPTFGVRVPPAPPVGACVAPAPKARLRRFGCVCPRPRLSGRVWPRPQTPPRPPLGTCPSRSGRTGGGAGSDPL
jgi:hypothetical protein